MKLLKKQALSPNGYMSNGIPCHSSPILQQVLFTESKGESVKNYKYNYYITQLPVVEPAA